MVYKIFFQIFQHDVEIPNYNENDIQTNSDNQLTNHIKENNKNFHLPY